nr:acyltransferase domain-containing protein [Streptomyces rubradiris]
MGRELLDTSPAFAGVVQECARLLTEWADWSLIDVLRGEADQELLERVDVIQVASFAMMAGLAALWASAGVRPDAVVGHSQGEIAAAYVAGALSLRDAMRSSWSAARRSPGPCPAEEAWRRCASTPPPRRPGWRKGTAGPGRRGERSVLGGALR